MARTNTEKKNYSKSKVSGSGSQSGKNKNANSATKPLSSAPKKTQAELAYSKTSEEIYADNRRSVFCRVAAILILFFLAVFLFLSFFNSDASFLHFIRISVSGMFGFGYYAFPFAFLYIMWFLTVHNDEPPLFRSVCVLLIVFFFTTLLQTLRDPTELTESLIRYLWTSGQTMTSGGLFPGLLAHGLCLLVSRPGAFIVCLVFMLLFIWKGFNLKLARFINTKANRKREVIRQAHESMTDREPETTINTWDDIKVLGTRVPSQRQFRAAVSAPRQLSDEERQSFDVPIGEELQLKPVSGNSTSHKTDTSSSDSDDLVFVQSEYSDAVHNKGNSFGISTCTQDVDIDIKKTDKSKRKDLNHKKSRQEKQNPFDISLEDTDDTSASSAAHGSHKNVCQNHDSGLASSDEMLVFMNQQGTEKHSALNKTEKIDPDLPFVSSKQSPLRHDLSQNSSQWDLPLGEPVNAYTAQIQKIVRDQNTAPIYGDEVQMEPKVSRATLNKQTDSCKDNTASGQHATITETECDAELPTTSINHLSLEKVKTPMMDSPTEREIEDGAKQAKKSGSLNKGEAEAAEALVSMEIAEAESNDSGAQYHFPDMKILKEAKHAEADNMAEMRDKVLRLEATLKSFGIDIKVENVVRGPSVTRYEMELKPGTKMSRITSLNEDIALSLGVASVRVAAVPGKSSTIGIEVPNTISTSVPIRSVMDSKEFRNAKSNLAFAVGKDISGEIIIGDIAKMPHLLIAGTTGSGKSVCMNSIIVSLLYRTKPEQCRMIMIDPKVVELSVYNGIPHLLIPVVTDAKKAAGALQWAVNEMERRYNLLAEYNVRDLAGYNKQAMQRSDIQPLPQIVVIIDELADLMLVAAKEVENSIVRIAQKARAAGMHLVIATQRPSANVITGLMKANIPSRIAFAVSSAIDSRIILDTGGAEKLLGKGDMLFAPIGSGSPKRVQGCFITDDEVESVVSAVRESGAPDYDDSISAQLEHTISASLEDDSDSGNSTDSYDGDPQFAEAVEVVLDTKQASVSMLQRRLRLGYAHAARIVDEMEDKGIVGPFEGSKPRQLLVTREQWNTMVGINPNAKAESFSDDISMENHNTEASDYD